jgi:hypothetical protein
MFCSGFIPYGTVHVLGPLRQVPQQGVGPYQAVQFPLKGLEHARYKIFACLLRRMGMSGMLKR